MTFRAKVVADSVSLLNGRRLTTLQLFYPRFIHAELMTHRVFSRNASSSRAIPVKKLVGMALEDPAFFVHVGANKAGMKANTEVDADTKSKFYKEWVELARKSAEYALRWSEDYGIHKQVANRAMEPWHHIAVVVTSTNWRNWFDLRMHEDAMPEIQELARQMYHALSNSNPIVRGKGDWHLPYVLDSERKGLGVKDTIKLSVARCARVSYMNHDGSEPNPMKDFQLHDDLVVQEPLHASPAEHQATPSGFFRRLIPGWTRSNFDGWTQYRKFLEAQKTP